MNEALASVGINYKLALVDPATLVPLEKNAHFMKHETFANLVENVKRDRALTSIPFCWKNPEDNKYYTLSGNHRVKSAIAAGIKIILIIYDDRPLTRQERVAIQLSHNSIVGQDDPAILKDLWAEINDLGLKYYAGLDDKSLKTLADASLASLSEMNLRYRVITFLFLPEEVEFLDQAFAAAQATVAGEEVHLLPINAFAMLIDALDKTKASWKVKNSAVGLFLILKVFERHLLDLAEGWLDENGLKVGPSHEVPIESILGSSNIPASVALKLNACVSTMKPENSERWKALEVLADQYLKSSGDSVK